jgi:magnesium transporter
MAVERKLCEEFVRAHPVDAASAVESLSIADATGLLAQLTDDLAARVLQGISPAMGSELLTALPAEKAGGLLEKLPLDTGAALLRRLGAERAEGLLAHVPRDLSSSLRRLLGFPEGTAGAMVDSEVLTLPVDISVGESRRRVRRFPKRVSYYLYVLDRAGVLAGVLTLRELLLASTSSPLASVMHPDVVRLRAGVALDSIRSHPGWSVFRALPVVDDSGKFVGMLRHRVVFSPEGGVSTVGGSEATLATVLALGDLCWSGLAKTLGGAFAAFLPAVDDAASSKERPDGSAS